MTIVTAWSTSQIRTACSSSAARTYARTGSSASRTPTATATARTARARTTKATRTAGAPTVRAARRVNTASAASTAPRATASTASASSRRERGWVRARRTPSASRRAGRCRWRACWRTGNERTPGGNRLDLDDYPRQRQFWLPTSTVRASMSPLGEAAGRYDVVRLPPAF